MDKRIVEPIFTSGEEWLFNACLHFSHNPTDLYATANQGAKERGRK